MLVLFIQVENVRDLEIFIKNIKTKKQVDYLRAARSKHFKRLEKCSDGESFEDEAGTEHEIRLYPESGMFEWIEHNRNMRGFNITSVGRADYNNQQMVEVLLTIYLQKIPFIYKVLG
ncbi:Hypothetical protein BRZCDTV_1 [Brazilian cedratvirus IHUMI]|uniref:Uncharacterized protein n=1 Tax=Brazilian cedratvirus IHUMI TaxID=2126980 RepID=A0A2R8FCZ1_9VIRU|nr:Hypothetical protein BRZCDTV_1 [Brazilian cedratvirus IHUMI]